MNQKHEHWGSSFGFVMAAAGSAIGLGNVWKFPYITGMNGGGAFVLVYLVCIALIGLPVMLAELSIGRASQSDPIGAFHYFSFKSARFPKILAGYGLGLGTALAYYGNYGLAAVLLLLSGAILRYGWKAAGISCALVAAVILSYYAIIGGWILLYMFKAFGQSLNFSSPEAAGMTFVAVAANGPLSAGMAVAFLAAGSLVCWFGVKKGIEAASKVMMPLLLVLILLLVVRSLTLPGAMKGVSFFLKPDFSKLSAAGALEALGHAFFSLSLGMGILITYGGYLPKKKNILSAALWIAGLDTLIALLAGLAIFPAVFAMGFNPAAGPSLIFNILPVTFNSIPGGLGWLWNGIFFGLMLIAALTSSISLLETSIATCMIHLKWSRRVAVIVTTVAIGALGVLIAWSTTSWDALLWMKHGWEFVFGAVRDCLFDQIDYICSSWILPLNGLAAALYAGWVWGVSRAARELYRQGEVSTEEMTRRQRYFRMKLPVWSWAFFIRFVTPVLVLLTFLYAAGFFKL